jgi:hypothetical protein
MAVRITDTRQKRKSTRTYECDGSMEAPDPGAHFGPGERSGGASPKKLLRKESRQLKQQGNDTARKSRSPGEASTGSPKTRTWKVEQPKDGDWKGADADQKIDEIGSAEQKFLLTDQDNSDENFTGQADNRKNRFATLMEDDMDGESSAAEDTDHGQEKKEETTDGMEPPPKTDRTSTDSLSACSSTETNGGEEVETTPQYKLAERKAKRERRKALLSKTKNKAPFITKQVQSTLAFKTNTQQDMFAMMGIKSKDEIRAEDTTSRTAREGHDSDISLEKFQNPTTTSPDTENTVKPSSPKGKNSEIDPQKAQLTRLTKHSTQNVKRNLSEQLSLCSPKIEKNHIFGTAVTTDTEILRDPEIDNMSQEGTRISAKAADTIVSHQIENGTALSGDYYNHEEKKKNQKQKKKKEKKKKEKNKKIPQTSFGSYRNRETSLGNYRNRETSLGSYHNREESKQIFYDIFETRKSSLDKREKGASQKNTKTWNDLESSESDPSKEPVPEKTNEETSHTEDDASSVPSLINKNGGDASDSDDEDGVPPLNNRRDSDNDTNSSQPNSGTNSQSESEPVKAWKTHPRSSKKVLPHPMIEISFTAATSDEEDDSHEGSDQQEKTPAVEPSNLVDPAAALAGLGDRGRVDTKTGHDDPSSNPEALSNVLSSCPSEENHAKSDPSTPEAMSKSQSAQTTDPQDLVISKVSTKTVDGDSQSDPLAKQDLTNEPSGEDYAKCEPPVPEAMPISKHAQIPDPQDLSSSDCEVPREKKYNLTKRREFNRKRAAGIIVEPSNPFEEQPNKMSPEDRIKVDKEQPAAPVTLVETTRRIDGNESSDDDSEANNDDLDHETSDEDRSINERDTEEQPEVASTGHMSDGARSNGEDECENSGSEGESDTDDTDDEERPWDDSESDKEEDDMEIALSTTSDETVETTPKDMTTEDMDVENDNVILTSTENEITGRMQIMQDKCREASTVRSTGKPLNNTKRNDEDKAEAEDGFKTVLSKQDGQANRKKAAEKVSHKKRLGSLQQLDLSTHERIRLQLSFSKAQLDAGKVISAIEMVKQFLKHWNKIDSRARLTVMTGEFKATPSKSYVYDTDKFPSSPDEVKNSLHAFYAKGHNRVPVLNITIEITSNQSFWITRKSLPDILNYTVKQGLHIQLINPAMVNEIAIGFITDTSSVLNHNKKDIEEEIRRLCRFPDHAPIGCYDKTFTHHCGVPGHKYSLQVKGMVVCTDKSNASEINGLILENSQSERSARVHLPDSAVILPCFPNDAVNRNTHERLMKVHVNVLATMRQCRIAGLQWEKANTQCDLVQDCELQKIHKRLSLSPFEFLVKCTFTDGDSPVKAFHSVARTTKGDIIINVTPEQEDRAIAMIHTAKMIMKESFDPDQYTNIFDDDDPLEAIPVRRGQPSRTDLNNTPAAAKHYAFINELALTSEDIPPTEVYQPIKRTVTSKISYAGAVANNQSKSAGRGMPGRGGRHGRNGNSAGRGGRGAHGGRQNPKPTNEDVQDYWSHERSVADNPGRWSRTDQVQGESLDHKMPDSWRNRMGLLDEDPQSVNAPNMPGIKPNETNNDTPMLETNTETESPPVTASQVRWMIDAAIKKHQATSQTCPTDLSLPELVSLEVKSQMSDLTSSIAATAANQPRIIADHMKNMMHGSDYFKTAVQAKLTEFKVQLSNKAPTDWNAMVDEKLSTLEHENQQTKLALEDSKARYSNLLELQRFEASTVASMKKRLECATKNNDASCASIQSAMVKISQVEIELSKRPKLQKVRDETDAKLTALENKVLTEVELRVSAIEAAIPLIGGIVMWNGIASLKNSQALIQWTKGDMKSHLTKIRLHGSNWDEGAKILEDPNNAFIPERDTTYIDTPLMPISGPPGGPGDDPPKSAPLK